MDKRPMRIISVLIIGIFLIGFSSSIGVSIDPPVPNIYNILNESTATVNSSDFWDSLDTPADITYDDLSAGDVNALGYTGTFNYLAGVVGQLSMDGDPWYLGGTDLELAQELLVRGVTTLGNNLMPNQTLSWDIGSGALRWRNLYVTNVSSDYLDATYGITTLGNITAEGGFINGVNITGISTTESDPLAYNGTLAYVDNLVDYNSTGLIINWSTEPFTESDPYWSDNFTLYNSSWSYYEADTDTWNTSEEIWTAIDNGTFYKDNEHGYYNSTDFTITDYLLASNQTLNGNYSASVDFCIPGGNCLSNIVGGSSPFWTASGANFYNDTASVSLGANYFRNRFLIKDDSQGPTGVTMELESDDGPGIFFNDTGSGFGWGFNLGGSDSDFYFSRNGTWDLEETIMFFDWSSKGIGVNKLSATTALDVNGTVTATNFTGDGRGLTNVVATNPLWTTTSTEIYNTTANFELGIGKQPDTALHILDDGIGTTGNIVILESDDGPAIKFLDTAENHYWRMNVGGAGPDFYLDYDTTTQLFATETGNFGLGKAIANYRLDVDGTVNATAYLGNGSQLTDTEDSDWTLSGSDYYNSVNNFAIGRTTAREKLHIQDDSIGTSGWLMELESDDGPGFILNDTGEESYWWINTGGTGPDLYINHETDNRWFLNQDGYMGLGTILPIKQIHIVDDAILNGVTIDNIGDGVYSFPVIQTRKAKGTIGSEAVVADGNVISMIQFQGYSGAASNYVEAANIIATIDGTPDSAGDATDMPGRLQFATTPDGAGASVTRITIKENGYVGIGDTTPSYQLELSTDSAGKPGAGGLWTVVSDERIKENINNITNALDVINSLRPVNFNFIEDYRNITNIEDKVYSGFIAQEYKQVFPDAVNIKGNIEKVTPEVILDNGTKTLEQVEVIVEDAMDLNAGDLIPYLVKGIQEQQVLIKDLQSENTLIKSCASSSKDFAEYKLCIGGLGGVSL